MSKNKEKFFCAGCNKEKKTKSIDLDDGTWQQCCFYCESILFVHESLLKK